MVEKEDRIGEFISGTVETFARAEEEGVVKFVEKIMEGINAAKRRYCVLIKTWEQSSGIIEVRWEVRYCPPKEE
jgi:hypothetical protein